MKDWDYANTSHWLSINGGPEKAIQKLKSLAFSNGFNAGKKDALQKLLPMVPIIYSAGIVTSLVVEKIKTKKAMEKEIEYEEAAVENYLISNLTEHENMEQSEKEL